MKNALDSNSLQSLFNNYHDTLTLEEVMHGFTGNRYQTIIRLFLTKIEIEGANPLRWW